MADDKSNKANPPKPPMPAVPAPMVAAKPKARIVASGLALPTPAERNAEQQVHTARSQINTALAHLNTAIPAVEQVLTRAKTDALLAATAQRMGVDLALMESFVKEANDVLAAFTTEAK